MQGNRRRSSTPTVSVSMSLNNIQPALRILRLLNPRARPSIPLDDLVPITQRHLLLPLPQSNREQVKTALQKFIFERKTFKITPDQLIECVSQVPSVQSSVSRNTVSEVPNVNVKLRSDPESPLTFDFHETPKTPIPKPLQKAIRSLSQERKFIAYGSDLSIPLFKLSPARKRQSLNPYLASGHRRVISTLSDSSMGVDPSYTSMHNRKNDIRKTIEREDIRVAQIVESHKPKTKGSPETRVKTVDSSFVGSSATTPKKDRSFVRAANSPTREDVKIPSLKEGMEKLLEVRQQYFQMCQKQV